MFHRHKDEEQGAKRHTSRAEQEVTDLLRMLLERNPLPSRGVYPLASEHMQGTHCIAYIVNGQAMPLMHLEGEPFAVPATPGERMHLLAQAAQCLLDGVLNAAEHWEERYQQVLAQLDEGTEGKTGQAQDGDDDGMACV